MMTLDEARGWAAQAWCNKGNEQKAIDPVLAESFALILEKRVEEAVRAAEIDKARRTLTRHLLENSDLLLAYRDNVAMKLYDLLGPLPPERRNLAAIEVLRLLFSTPFRDPDVR